MTIMNLEEPVELKSTKYTKTVLFFFKQEKEAEDLTIGKKYLLHGWIFLRGKNYYWTRNDKNEEVLVPETFFNNK